MTFTDHKHKTGETHADITIFTRHVPPSVNACYSNVQGKGRVRTKRYREWAAAAGWDFNGHGSVKGAFVATITIDRHTRHVLSDIDNRGKPVLDLLQTHGVIENDHYCERVVIEWGEAKGGVVIRIEPYVGNVEAAA